MNAITFNEIDKVEGKGKDLDCQIIYDSSECDNSVDPNDMIKKMNNMFKVNNRKVIY